VVQALMSLFYEQFKEQLKTFVLTYLLTVLEKTHKSLKTVKEQSSIRKLAYTKGHTEAFKHAQM